MCKKDLHTLPQWNEISYPDFINICGDLIGTLRNMSNLEMMEEVARYKRGDRGDEAHRLGLRAEFIARFYCFNRGYEIKCPPIFADRPLGVPDIICGDKRFDVKGIRTDAPDMLVNVEAHGKVEKSITHYWFIQNVARSRARHWIFSYEMVTTWPVKNCRYSDAHFMALPPLNGQANQT